MRTNYKPYPSTDGVFHISSLHIASRITCTTFEASDSKLILLFQKPYLCQTEIKHGIEIWFCICSFIKTKRSFLNRHPLRRGAASLIQYRAVYKAVIKQFPALMCRMSLQWESQTFQSCFLGTIFFFLNPGIILSITIKHNRIFFSC